MTKRHIRVMQTLREYVEGLGLNQEQFGEKAKLSQSFVSLLFNGKRKVKDCRVFTLEAMTGIPRHVWRPDLYPPEDLKKSKTTSQHKKNLTSRGAKP
jgi:transcriptional regulator with XRE-family HTH domain